MGFLQRTWFEATDDNDDEMRMMLILMMMMMRLTMMMLMMMLPMIQGREKAEIVWTGVRKAMLG